MIEKKSVRIAGFGRRAAAAALTALLCLTGPGPAAFFTEPITAWASQQQTAQNANVALPEIVSEGAALYDVTHGTFLYEKNGGKAYYPASITKVMTALLAAERLSADQQVTFSSAAVTGLEQGAVTLHIKAGDSFRAEDLLYGLWLKSANEIGNGLAEAVSGSVPAFVQLMNERAAALGCTGTHFANTNGLNNASHLTTAHDMALITAAAMENPIIRKVAATKSYTFPATSTEPAARLTMGHKMCGGTGSYAYEGFMGGKTGYTSKAGNTLVSAAQRGNVRLVAVILKSKHTHYSDTERLFNYGFAVCGQQSGAGNTQSAAVRAQSGAGNTQTVAGSTQETAQMIEQSAGGPAADSRDAGGQSVQTVPERQPALRSEWYMSDGRWHYMDEDGKMAVRRWIMTGGFWYYVGDDGGLLVDTVTPDGYRVDANGIWIQGGEQN